MDTIIQPVIQRPRREKYRHHPVDFKRAVVQQSLAPGASVSRIAREHNVNANQIFAWRKLYREGQLVEHGQDLKLLPVGVVNPESTTPESGEALSRPGMIELAIGKARLRIEGRVDESALAQVLAHLLR